MLVKVRVIFVGRFRVKDIIWLMAEFCWTQWLNTTSSSIHSVLVLWWVYLSEFKTHYNIFEFPTAYMPKIALNNM